MSSQFDFSQNGVDGKAEKGECEELGERNGSQWENMRACLEGKDVARITQSKKGYVGNEMECEKKKDGVGSKTAMRLGANGTVGERI